MQQFAIEPGRDEWHDGQERVRLVRRHNPNQASVWDLTEAELLEVYQTIHAHFVAKIVGQPAEAEVTTQAVVYSLIPERRRTAVGPCPCACNSGGFCGGCGHAGCGRR